MSFKAPFYSKEEIRRRAEGFLAKYNSDNTLLVPIERIVEFEFNIDIVPLPGLQSAFDVVAFISRDLAEIRIDEYVYLHRAKRYRFSLARELAHRILHEKAWHEIDFTDIQSWKTALSSISDKEYGFLEFHANSFAGLVLVPPEDLDEKFIQCKDMLRNNGMEVTSDTPGLTDIIEDYIADHFAVSTSVIHRRMEADGLWRDF